MAAQVGRRRRARAVEDAVAGCDDFFLVLGERCVRRCANWHDILRVQVAVVVLLVNMVVRHSISAGAVHQIPTGRARSASF